MKVVAFAVVTALFSVVLFAAKKPVQKTIINGVTAKQVSALRKIEDRYQKEHGIQIALTKTVKIETLSSETKSFGKAWFLKGKMRLEIQEPYPSQIIADGKYIWLVSPAPKEFKGAKTQVTQAALSSDRAKSQGLIQLLTQGGLLKYFKVVGVQDQGSETLYFLQPKKQSAEFKRAQIAVGKKTQVISSLQYWDRNDSETIFKFTKTQFNQKIKNSFFDYQPPKDAEITTL